MYNKVKVDQKSDQMDDILIFFSDQHNAKVTGFAGDPLVRTPNMDALAAEGVAFEAAYTSCPLCVPARMSFLTGRLPSNTGVFTNNGILSSEQSTFLHSLAAKGYETVLCGRMHFIGEDQRHGFTKRIFGDFTPVYLGRSGKNRTDLGDFSGTTAEKYCTNVYGKGDSPVLAYDRSVVERAIEYLKNDHDKPQAIVVGIYGPHFPYVAPVELYDYYRSRINMPKTYIEQTNYDLKEIEHRKNSVPEEDLLSIRAAYYGMVEHVDSLLGVVKKSWKEYLSRNNRKGKFLYISDHGDQIGERQMYGKKTFFEESARVPMIWSGKDIQCKRSISQPVNLMDIGPTLCEMTASPLPPEQDGKSLKSLLNGTAHKTKEGFSISEYVEEKKDLLIPGRMLRKGYWKLIFYFGSQTPLLFNLENDPHELNNLADTFPDKVQEMQQLLSYNWDPSIIIANYKKSARHHDIIKKWGSTVQLWMEKDRWRVPEESTLKSPGIRFPNEK
jgi:choline-sulfatase